MMRKMIYLWKKAGLCKIVCITACVVLFSGFAVPDSVLSALKFWVVQASASRQPLESMEFARVELDGLDAYDVTNLLFRLKSEQTGDIRQVGEPACCLRETPLPDSIAWVPADTDKSFRYWLAVPKQEIRQHAKIVVRHIGNQFDVIESDYTHFMIRVNDDMVDITKPIKVIYKGRPIFKKKVVRTIEAIYKTMEEQTDTVSVFSAEMKLSLLPEERQGSDTGAKIWKVASMLIPK